MITLSPRAADRVRRAVKKTLDGDARHAVTHYKVAERYAEVIKRLGIRK